MNWNCSSRQQYTVVVLSVNSSIVNTLLSIPHGPRVVSKYNFTSWWLHIISCTSWIMICECFVVGITDPTQAPPASKVPNQRLWLVSLPRLMLPPCPVHQWTSDAGIICKEQLGASEVAYRSWYLLCYTLIMHGHLCSWVPGRRINLSCPMKYPCLHIYGFILYALP